MITIIDYGAGNIKSIQNMLKRLGQQSMISNNIEEIEKSEKLILPGVGHFDHGMRELKKSGLVDVIKQKVQIDMVPLLGICLGAQLLGHGSEEGEEEGLSLLDIEVVGFDRAKMQSNQKVPHMGWNYIQAKKESPLLKDLSEDSRFYFVHSFHMRVNDSKLELCSTEYGYSFASAVSRDNIFGVQFHPEKSHKYGKAILKNFAEI